jgi:hypothetical protein
MSGRAIGLPGLVAWQDHTPVICGAAAASVFPEEKAIKIAGSSRRLSMKIL